MAETLVPTQRSEYTRCGACERGVTEHVPDPPTAQLFDVPARDYQRRRGAWSFCPHCLQEFESVTADLDRLEPVRRGYDADRDARPTACGRCRVPLDGGGALLDVWGNGGCESWFTGLCEDCADALQERIEAIPTTEPPGADDIYWPPALAVPEAELVTAEAADGDALQATLRSLVTGDTVRLSAYQHGRVGRGMGQHLDVVGRVTAVGEPERPPPAAHRVLVEPVDTIREYVAGRSDPYEPGHSTAPYRVDPGPDVDLSALPRTLAPGVLPVVRPADGDPLAVTVLDRLDDEE